MAKIAKSIKLGNHVYKNNVFKISFQRTGSDKHDLRYFAEFGADGIQLPYETRDALGFLSFQQLLQISGELVKWTYKPRRELSDKTPAQHMTGIIEAMAAYKADLVVLKKERRAAAEANRIQIEAPCLDWAMSVTKEMDDEPAIFDQAEPTKSTLSVTAGITDAMIDAAFGGRLRWVITSASSVPLPTLTDLITAVERSNRNATLEFSPTSEQEAEFRSLLGLPEFEKATSDRISAMEATVWVKRSDGSTSTSLRTDPVSRTRRRCQSCWPLLYQGIKSSAEVRAEFVFAPPKLPTEAIEKAVNVIHTHARRFLSPMSFREHDFLRAIIQEEIEKAVGDVP